MVSLLTFAPRLIGLSPLGHNVTESKSAGDDWFAYHRFALSVVDEGWTIPAVAGGYSRPGGFAYVYFVALIYSILGVRSEAVYLIQGLLLMAAIAGMVLAFGPRLSAWGALGLTLALVLFLAVDVFQSTTFRLLSENLLIPLVAFLLWAVLNGTATTRLPWFVGAGVLAGLCALTRPNVVFFGPTIAVLLALYPWHAQPVVRRRAAAAFLAAFAVAASVLPMRNLAVGGDLGVMAVLRPQGWRLPSSAPGAAGPNATLAQRATAAVTHYAARTAYVLGVPHWMAPAYRVRTHWLLMWAGLALYLIARPHREFWEVLLLALLVAYLVPLLAVAQISSYGVRMLAPAVLFILPLSARGAEIAVARVRGALP